MTRIDGEIWWAAGVRTPFAKVEGPLGAFDAIALSVPVVQHMSGTARPEFAVWGAVIPNLGRRGCFQFVTRDDFPLILAAIRE